MNKESDATREKAESEKASKLKAKSALLFVNSHLRALKDKGKKHYILYLIIFVLVILFVVLQLSTNKSQNHKVTASDNKKITSLLKSFDCSPSAMNSVASDQPNPQALGISVDLLNYRSSCDVKNQHYAQAIVVFKQEKTYCELEKNIPCANDIQIFITNVSSYAHQITKTSSVSTKTGATK